MKNVCFITNELYPFKPGGIGRLMYNFAVQNREHPTNKCRFFFLIPATEISDTNEIASYFQQQDLGTVVVTPTTFAFLSAQEHKLFSQLETTGYSKNVFMRKSLEYYNGLLYLEAKYQLQLDIIEFPDYGAWGFSSIHAKHAGLAFKNSILSVRLHSTEGLIHQAEPFYHPKAYAEKSFHALEQQSIALADLVVSHLEIITQINQDFYQFDATWRAKVVHEFPPIFLETEEITPKQDNSSSKTENFVFSSRLQPFKRPDLFIKAAVIFLSQNLDYTGKFYLVAYGWDYKYIKWLKNLVVPEYKEQIVFILNPEAGLRNALISQAIVVIPSNYESLCLFAYESALRNNKIILNQNCAAFGQANYWQAGNNCLQFDGSAEALATTYAQALKFSTAKTQALPTSTCYWHQETTYKQLPKLKTCKGKMTIIAYGFSSLAQVNFHLSALASLLTNPDIKIALILNQTYKTAYIDNFNPQVAIHYCAWNTPNPNYIRQFLSNLNSDYISFLLPNMQVQAEFYTLALKALQQQPYLSIVTAHTRMLTTADTENMDWQAGNRDDYAATGKIKLALGTAPKLANTDLDLISNCSCLRLSELDLNNIQEQAADYFLALLLNTMLRDNEITLVIPKILITEIAVTNEFLQLDNVLDSIN